MAYAEEKSKELSQDDKADLLEQFKADLGEAKAFMEPIQQRMDRDYEAYRNHKQGSRFEEIDFRISDLYEYVETVVPIITNNRIRAVVRSDYNEYVTHAKGMNDILDNTYDINNWDYMQQELMRMALINRSALAYTGYDTKYRNGTGKLCIDICNSRWAWFDPSPTNFEDSRFFFYAVPMRKTQVFKMYPDKVNDIKASLVRNTSGFSKGNENSTNDKAGGWFKTFIGTIKNYLVFNGTNQAVSLNNLNIVNDELSEQQKHKNVIAYIEYWYRDDKDEWRKSCWADDVLLEDEPNPFAHGRLPYDVLSPVKDPYSVLGIPISEQLESLAYQRNAMLNYVVNNAKLHSDPPFLWNTTYGNVKDPAQLKEQGGRNIIPVNNPDMIPLNAIADYMTVPALPGYTVQMFDQLGAIKDTVTGVNDSFRGTQQGTSGKEVQLQQEAAYTRIKTMIDQFELFNKNIAEKIIVNAMQFYTQHREFRIKGDYQKYEFDQQRIANEGGEMPFDIQKVQKGMTPEGNPVYDRSEFFMFANPNEWTKLDPEGAADDGEEQDEKETSGEDSRSGNKAEKANEEKVEKAFKVLQMTVEIEAGSSLPQSRLARREEALELYGAQALDQEALLEAYDWPNREEIIKRMNDKQAQAQQAQAQAAQVEAQGKVQAEKLKSDTQIKLKEMDLQQTQMQSDAKIAQQEVQNQGDVAEQGVQNSGNSLAEVIEQVRQSNPQAQQLTDDEIIEALRGGVQ